jgi:hypothetical protein
MQGIHGIAKRRDETAAEEEEETEEIAGMNTDERR